MLSDTTQAHTQDQPKDNYLERHLLLNAKALLRLLIATVDGIAPKEIL